MKIYNIVERRMIWYLLSLALIVPGLISLMTQGLNLGIDFTGGSIFDLKFQGQPAISEVRKAIDRVDLELGNPVIQETTPGEFLIRTRDLQEAERDSFLSALKQEIGDYEVLREEKVGPVIGKELTFKALLALGVASILMIIYISFRFEFKSGIAAIIAILHDVLVTLGIFSLLQLEISSAFVAAILTIIGYSINDTIVIFDRVRENLQNRKKSESVAYIMNKSIMQTLTRSINTVLTTLFVLFALFFFGGATLSNFILAMIIGIISGVYSSIFTACPIWHDLKRIGMPANPHEKPS